MSKLTLLLFVNSRPFFNIYVADGIVFSDQRMVVPQSLRSQMLGLIHESHFRIEKSISHARELLYWPKMVADIECTIANCELCIKYRNNQRREPMISRDILNERFFKIGNLLTNWQKSADLTKLQSHQKYYYDLANSKSLPPLWEGDVCYRKNKMWNKSVICLVRNESRSLVVRNEQGVLRRNRHYLYKTNLKPPVFNKCHSSYCYQGNRPVQSSNVVNYQTDLPIRGSDTQLFNFISESPHRSTSRYGKPIRFPVKYRDFLVS